MGPCPPIIRRAARFSKSGWVIRPPDDERDEPATAERHLSFAARQPPTIPPDARCDVGGQQADWQMMSAHDPEVVDKLFCDKHAKEYLDARRKRESLDETAIARHLHWCACLQRCCFLISTKSAAQALPS